MGRFSCFYGQDYGQKQKKPGQPSFETMVKMLQLGSHNNESENTIEALKSHEFHVLKNEASNLESGLGHLTLTSSSWKSGKLNCDHDAGSNVDSVHYESAKVRRCVSVGCELDRKGTVLGGNIDDDFIPQAVCCEGSQDCDDHAEISPTSGAKSLGTSLPDQDQEILQSMSPQLRYDVVNHVPFVDNLLLNMEGLEDSHWLSYTEYHDGSGQNSPTQSCISKCYSMPSFVSMSVMSPACAMLTSCDRSFEDLNVLSNVQENASAHEASAVEVAELKKVDDFYNPGNFDGDIAVLDTYNSYNYGCSTKDWIVPMQNEIEIVRHDGGNSACDLRDHFTNKDFKIKQIEDWVDLQYCGLLDNKDEVAQCGDGVKSGSEFTDGLAKLQTKVNPGVEAAKRYISSLTPTASSAYLASYGLVAMPLLSAFVSLKVLILSGNSIVRITAGALPRGLHVLNLCKNKIATIEGLRELTRLRVFDLSYNKISRIGHGLASCSTLKELYLAGNKISEVEGLHRLLKLTVLDLRFNKIATSKCLGQLAANYNSLQAISVEGNPAQKNVGDEQLKKYLLGLLPHLAYYNRHNIKTSTLKDSSDRSVRLGISDRGLRSDHKSLSRRGSGTPKRLSHSSTHVLKGQASDFLKQSKGKHVPVPPSGVKSSHRHHHLNSDNKLQDLRSGRSLHKSRSEGTLAVF